MFVKMLVNKKGCDRGLNGVVLEVREYQKGEIYDLGDFLGNNFVGQEVAEKVDASKLKAPKVDVDKSTSGPESKEKPRGRRR